MPGVSHSICSGARFFLLKVARVLPLALLGAEVGLGHKETGFPVLSIQCTKLEATGSFSISKGQLKL